MAFLVTKTTDRFRLVWEGDPAVKAKKGSTDWIAESAAKLKTGQRPDVMVCVPLSGSDVLRIIQAIEHDSSLLIQAAALGVVEIEQADGARITEPEEVRKVLLHAGNLEAISSLSGAIFQASREGVDTLPFRDGSAEMERHDNGRALGSKLPAMPA